MRYISSSSVVISIWDLVVCNKERNCQWLGKTSICRREHNKVTRSRDRGHEFKSHVLRKS